MRHRTISSYRPHLVVTSLRRSGAGCNGRRESGLCARRAPLGAIGEPAYCGTRGRHGACALPTRSPSAEGPRRPLGFNPRTAWTLARLFIFFIGQAGTCTYLAPLGEEHGISPAIISSTLTWLNVAGLVGTLGPARSRSICRRCRRSAPWQALPSSPFSLFFRCTLPSLPFAVSACCFYFAWCASLPFQFTIIARCDPNGAAGAAAPAVDGLGLACGAAVGGVLISRFGVGAVGALCALGTVLGIACYLTGSFTTRAAGRAVAQRATGTLGRGSRCPRQNAHAGTH